MRSLVKRYVAAMIRDARTEEGLTEENFKVTPLVLVMGPSPSGGVRRAWSPALRS